MKKIILLFVLCFTTTIFSQQKSEFWKQVRLGGAFGFNIGSATNITIAPSAVYDFNNGFFLGSGVNYQYNKYRSATTTIYGASFITLYNIPKFGVQLSGEYEHLFAKQTVGLQKSNFNFPALYFGITFINGRVSGGLRYDVLHDKNRSIYSSAVSPIVRFYF